jgi:hypothetical protein
MEAGDLNNHSLHDKGEERDDKGKVNYLLGLVVGLRISPRSVLPSGYN